MMITEMEMMKKDINNSKEVFIIVILQKFT